MDADWYKDPLGRFDGRYFDGERWTDRVRRGQRSETDPIDISPTELDPPTRSSRVLGPAVQQPAVAPLRRRIRRASMIEESPARVVAVLDDSISEPGGVRHRAGRRRRWYLAVGLAAAIVAAMVAILGRGGTETVQAANLDAEQVDRVEDVTEMQGETSSGEAQALDPEATSGSATRQPALSANDVIVVGDVPVLNGVPVLDDLAGWHRTQATERGVRLGAGAGCWFGHLGDAAVQVAHCGPVGVSDANELLYDLVPLAFEAASEGQLAQPVLDDITIDSVLANTLTLVGTPENPPPDAPAG